MVTLHHVYQLAQVNALVLKAQLFFSFFFFTRMVSYQQEAVQNLKCVSVQLPDQYNVRILFAQFYFFIIYHSQPADNVHLVSATQITNCENEYRWNRIVTLTRLWQVQLVSVLTPNHKPTNPSFLKSGVTMTLAQSDYGRSTLLNMSLPSSTTLCVARTGNGC